VGYKPVVRKTKKSKSLKSKCRSMKTVKLVRNSKRLLNKKFKVVKNKEGVITNEGFEVVKDNKMVQKKHRSKSGKAKEKCMLVKSGNVNKDVSKEDVDKTIQQVEQELKKERIMQAKVAKKLKMKAAKEALVTKETPVVSADLENTDETPIKKSKKEMKIREDTTEDNDEQERIKQAKLAKKLKLKAAKEVKKDIFIENIEKIVIARNKLKILEDSELNNSHRVKCWECKPEIRSMSGMQDHRRSMHGVCKL